MNNSNIFLHQRLESLSYHFMISGIGFALTGAIINFQFPTVTSALESTASAFMLFSLLFYRLSNHD